MFSKFAVMLCVVLLPVLGVPAQASILKVAAVTDGDTFGSTDCFYEENRSKPECQDK